MSRIEFFFDFGSPAAYLASRRVDGIAERTGATIVWRPILLGGVFKATGNASPATVPAKSAWMRRDLQRAAERHGITFDYNPYFPINTLWLMRAATAMDIDGRLRPFADVIFAAIWAHGRNMGDQAIVAGVLQDAGLDAQDIATRADTAAAKDRLKAVTEEAVARGVFGAPSLFVGDELFFGQDRLDLVEAAAKSE